VDRTGHIWSIRRPRRPGALRALMPALRVPSIVVRHRQETDADVRAGFYRTAAASLMAIADFVAAMPGLGTNDSARIAAYARNAATILLQTDLG
jgi:hypothetical protein